MGYYKYINLQSKIIFLPILSFYIPHYLSLKFKQKNIVFANYNFELSHI